jgi:E3 ubiquitin-protein ligase RNF14
MTIVFNSALSRPPVKTMDEDERSIELEVLENIYPELQRAQEDDPYTVLLNLDVDLDSSELIWIKAQNGNETGTLRYLPALNLQITLPHGYPEEKPPIIRLSTTPDWIPKEKITKLQNHVEDLWESWGRSQVIYTYIESLLTEAHNGFGLFTDSSSRSINVESSTFVNLMDFHARAQLKHFHQQTFSCEVCLESKKGYHCYEMSRCGHVFCKQCLRDYYTTCITEGEVFQVKCMAPKCTITLANGEKIFPAIVPAELLRIPLSDELVLRYVEMHRKKHIDADKDTVYCPREFCRAPARSSKHPKSGSVAEITEMRELSIAPPRPGETGNAKKKEERLAVCEKCDYAFCRVCQKGWHGDFKYCRTEAPTNALLAKEEKATMDYLRKFAAECPGCRMAIQKTHGCNHISCSQCYTHFCYVCGMWIDPRNPYRHFSEKGTECYQRLWDEDNEDGQLNGGYAGLRRYELEFDGEENEDDDNENVNEALNP